MSAAPIASPEVSWPASAPRTSPFEPLWRGRTRSTHRQFGTTVPSACGDASIEQSRGSVLGVTDVSGVPRPVLKGKDSGDLLAASGWPVPTTFFDAQKRDSWSFVARTGRTELFVEGPLVLSEAHFPRAIVYAREDASLLFTGSGVADFLAELTAVCIDLESSRLHLTDVLRMSGMILPRPGGSVPGVQIWMDASFALHAGKTLLTLAEDLGGGWVGTGAIEGTGILPAFE
jgi:sarcosine oxidase, subunit gamma